MKFNCLILDNDINEIVGELINQIEKDLVCINCPHKCCKDTSRCNIAMKNLLTDLKIFKESYNSQT